jgi:hypothetical protein
MDSWLWDARLLAYRKGVFKDRKQKKERKCRKGVLKTKVFNQSVLPVMTYGAETWTLTARLVHEFKVAQRATERALLGVSLRERIRNQVIR